MAFSVTTPIPRARQPYPRHATVPPSPCPPVVKYMLQEQDGYGVIAVSPRYAKQMASKLSGARSRPLAVALHAGLCKPRPPELASPRLPLQWRCPSPAPPPSSPPLFMPTVFWPLAAKPQRIGGILNALDMTDSFASSGMTLNEVGGRKWPGQRN